MYCGATYVPTDHVVSTTFSEDGDHEMMDTIKDGYMGLDIGTKTLSNYVNHITHTPLDAFMAETRWVAPRNKANAA